MFHFFKKPKNIKKFQIGGMHCASCATLIESELEDAGFKARCSYAKQCVEIEIEDTAKLNISKLKKIISKAGYELY